MGEFRNLEELNASCIPSRIWVSLNRITHCESPENLHICNGFLLNLRILDNCWKYLHFRSRNEHSASNYTKSIFFHLLIFTVKSANLWKIWVCQEVSNAGNGAKFKLKTMYYRRWRSRRNESTNVTMSQHTLDAWTCTVY